MKRLKAGALQMVTFIIVVIALLLSSFLILTHVHKQFRLQTNQVVDLVRMVYRGVDYNLTHELDSRDTLYIQRFDEDYKTLKVKKSFWGVFERVYSEAQIKNKAIYKTALIGQRQSQLKMALYLKDNSKPLIVVGNTTIEGTAYLPKRGIKTGNISGHSYYGTTYVNGNIKESRGLPSLHNDLQKHLKTIIGHSISNQNGVQYLDLNRNKKVINSFNDPLVLVYSKRPIVLSEMELSGHIIVQSDSKIIVDETSRLTDIILIAPTIEIKEHTEGVFQAIATKSIQVSENVKLDYPSALLLYGDYKREVEGEAPILEIKSKSEIKGSVLCIGNTAANNYDIQIKIDKNVIVEGEVYCHQNLELRGTVYGSVYTNSFIVKEGGTTYQNHLYNGKINANQLTKQYAGILFNNQHKDVMKWLY